jgi:3-hydroxyacyl-[acyl-carrier-protein] dehydratase
MSELVTTPEPVADEKTTLDILEIKAILPHRYPFLLIDRVIEIPDRDQKLMVFAGVDGAKFKRPVTPGDQLRIEVTVLNWRMTAVKLQGRITVDDKLACEATFLCMLVPRPHAAEKAAEPAE